MYIRIATLLIFITALMGCGDEFLPLLLDEAAEQASNPLVGTWSLETIDGESPADIFDRSEDSDETFAFYDFHNDGTWQLFVNWLKGENIIAIHIISGGYTVDGASYSMTVIESGLLDIAPEDMTISGVYEIEGDTLTLNDDEGSVIVLSKLL